MFNNYIAKKREVRLGKKLQEIKAELEWNNKYHKSIQPQLLENYNLRVKSFMQQMNEKPIIIQQATSKQIIREGLARFTFKNSEDWKSLHTYSQRLNFIKNQSLTGKRIHGNIEKLPDRNSCFIEFNPSKTEYRKREKLKEINKPMSFAKNAKDKGSSFRRKHRSLQVFKEKEKQENTIVNYDNESSFKDKTNKQTDNLSDFFEWRGRVDDIEFDAEQEERKKDLKETKIHFKKLMTLFLIGEQKNKKEIKQILDKCRYIKKKEKINTESTEIDHLASIVEKIREK